MQLFLELISISCVIAFIVTLIIVIHIDHLIEEVETANGIRPIPIASDIMLMAYPVSETPRKTYEMAVKTGGMYVVAWILPGHNAIRLADAQCVTELIAPGLISGETLHLVMVKLNELDTLDACSLHHLYNLRPNTLDECGLFGIDFLLPEN
jgi:hypothetical protein